MVRQLMLATSRGPSILKACPNCGTIMCYNIRNDAKYDKTNSRYVIICPDCNAKLPVKKEEG